MVSFMLIAAGAVYSTLLATCPVQYLVNCSGFTGGELVEITYHYETIDGRATHGSITISAGRFQPWLVMFMLTEGPERDDWQFQKLGDPNNPTAFLVFGHMKSPIKSVTITGNSWAPTVERRFRSPTKGPPR